MMMWIQYLLLDRFPDPQKSFESLHCLKLGLDETLSGGDGVSMLCLE